MAKKTGELTPLMKQYWDIKTLHQDKILLFRMGDFYELFYDDAIKASPLLGITLTSRNKKSDDQTPMCGFPHHAVAGPINKLLAAGHKVAICDQIEDPALAKDAYRSQRGAREGPVPQEQSAVREIRCDCCEKDFGQTF